MATLNANNNASRNLRIGIIFMSIGIIGVLLLYFLMIVPSFLIFLLTIYPFLSLIVMSFIFLTRGIRKLEISKRNIYFGLVIIIGGLIMAIGLDLLVSYLMTIL